ncbi:MAG: antibiotic biosynthesis monooxygenase [Thermomicrobiales bacterium]
MTATSATVPDSGVTTTIVTETRVLPEHTDDFARWQPTITQAVSAFPGYISSEVLPPSPPVQPDWVIMQRFTSNTAAQAWLSSPERQQLLVTSRPWLVGADDIHLIESDPQPASSAVSLVISTRVPPEKETAFRAWNGRINAAQARYAGFQGFKITPPVPGVQDDWLTVIQFDNEEHLNAWLTSPERQRILDEGSGIFTETHTRTVRSAFGQWFPLQGATGAAPVWKMNMLVLLGLYPIVFLFGFFVQTPFLMGTFGMPFWASLFVGNVVGVLLLTYVVPWVSNRFNWWLKPAGEDTSRQNLIGIVVLVALYVLMMVIFSRFPPALLIK